ncbi:MAG TPA: endolytic transglycosylase MltG, partial [Dehalococcoidia bacterium]|nr:endolytic transglycosylase MltG [Dehalococcoidia bacterium]
LDQPVSNSDRVQPFTVRPGDDAGTIGEHLESARLVSSGLAFRVLATSRGASASLKAGDYSLRPNMRPSEIVDVLRGGGVASHVLTVPEGWQLGQIRRALVDQAGLPPVEIEAALAADHAESFEFLRERPAGATLEGYLFPATYPLTPRPAATDLIRQMLQVFGRQVSADLRRSLEARDLTLHEAVTLASIVEREAVHADERPLIAGVFFNRLRRGMALQADPTVQYALARIPGPLASTGVWKAPLSRDDLQVDSPYNTYRHRGLPPGPIASPGRQSLEAVAAPEATEFLYFVAKPDGRHVFATSYSEHQRNVDQYQR